MDKKEEHSLYYQEIIAKLCHLEKQELEELRFEIWCILKEE